jgi:hypothetical protein
LSSLSEGGVAQRGRVRRDGLVYGLVAVYTFVVLLCAALALELGGAQPAGFRTAFGIVAVIFAIGIARTLMIGVYIEPDGVLIRNALSTRRLPWGQIDRFELGRWRGWGSFDCGVARLADGGQVTIFALNPPAGSEAAVLPLIDALNEPLGRATGRSFAPATLSGTLEREPQAR